jgi:hypothetical protein
MFSAAAEDEELCASTVPERVAEGEELCASAVPEIVADPKRVAERLSSTAPSRRSPDDDVCRGTRGGRSFTIRIRRTGTVYGSV